MSPEDVATLLDPVSPHTWPEGVAAAADLREAMARAVPHGPWSWHDRATGYPQGISSPRGVLVATAFEGPHPDIPVTIAPYIAAEHPGVVLAAVARWRLTAARHEGDRESNEDICLDCLGVLGCRDLELTVEEARQFVSALRR